MLHTEYGNYCPVTISAVITKIFEKLSISYTVHRSSSSKNQRGIQRGYYTKDWFLILLEKAWTYSVCGEKKFEKKQKFVVIFMTSLRVLNIT